MPPEANLKQALIAALAHVRDPEAGQSLLETGRVSEIEIDAGQVRVRLEGDGLAPPARERLRHGIESVLGAVEGVAEVRVEFAAEGPPVEPPAPASAAPKRLPMMAPAGPPRGGGGPGGGAHRHGPGQGMPPPPKMAGVGQVIAVASGKGGVGKSTVCVNLALALRHLGARVGLLDADIYGPSIPLMMDVNRRPQAGPDGKIQPLTSYGIKLMSLGFLLDEGTPVIWRGPMIQGVIKQFLHEVSWGELDYLMIDLPPGTGDAQLTLVQSVALNGAIIVTTPSDIALIDAAKGLNMFRTVEVPVFGVIENMSYFLCPHCHERSDVFSADGGRRVAEKLGAAFLGEIPLEIAIRKGGDEGKPVVAAAPDSAEARPFLDLARTVRRQCEGIGDGGAAGDGKPDGEKKGFLASLFSRD